MDVTDTSSGSVLVATLTQSHSKPRHHGYSVSHKTEAPPQGLPGGGWQTRRPWSRLLEQIYMW